MYNYLSLSHVLSFTLMCSFELKLNDAMDDQYSSCEQEIIGLILFVRSNSIIFFIKYVISKLEICNLFSNIYGTGKLFTTVLLVFVLAILKNC